MESIPLQQLREKRQVLWNDIRSVILTAGMEKRGFHASEQRIVDSGNEELNRMDARIEQMTGSENRAQRADDLRSMGGRVTTTGAGGWERSTDNATLHAMGLSAMGRGEGLRSFDFNYSEGFMEQRALAIGANGPSTIPVAFADFVAVYQRTLNPTYSLATVISSTNGETLTIPRLTADLTQYNPGEATAVTESTPTITSVTLSVVSYKALSYVSQEFVQDEAVGVQKLIADSAGRAIGLAAGTDFTTGTNGFITLGTNGGTAAGTATGNSVDANMAFFGPTDLSNLYYSAPVPYRFKGSWQMSTDAISRLRRMRSTTGEFLFDPATGPALEQGATGMLMGRPIFENPAMAACASATKSIAFGDFSAYIVKEVVPLRVESSTEFLFDKDQVAFKTVARMGGTLPDASAIRFMVCANT